MCAIGTPLGFLLRTCVLLLRAWIRRQGPPNLHDVCFSLSSGREATRIDTGGDYETTYYIRNRGSGIAAAQVPARASYDASTHLVSYRRQHDPADEHDGLTSTRGHSRTAILTVRSRFSHVRVRPAAQTNDDSRRQ